MNIIDRILVSPAAVDRWHMVVRDAVEHFCDTGFKIIAEIPDEQAELLDGNRLRVYAVIDGRDRQVTVEMIVQPGEWEFASQRQPSLN